MPIPEQIQDHDLLNPAELHRELAASRHALPVLKHALKTAQEKMDQRFRSGGDIRQLIYGRAWIVDQVLTAAWQLFDWPDDKHVALIAEIGRAHV